MDDLIKKTNQALRVHSMVDKGDAVIVGVSGGADSVCLLLALSELADEWELNLTVAHLDHSTYDAHKSCGLCVEVSTHTDAVGSL